MKKNFDEEIYFQKVSDLESQKKLFVEDGNHGEYRPLQEEFVDHGIPFIRPPNLVNGMIDFRTCQKINTKAFSRVRKGIGKGGDIILTHNATIGRVAITNITDPVFVANPQTTVWRILDNESIDRNFLYYFMKSNGFQDQLEAFKGRNATFDYVSLTKQRELVIPLPSINYQRAIGNILRKFDQKIHLNTQTNQTLESIAQAIFKSWFVDFEPVKAKMTVLAEGGSREQAKLAAMGVISGKSEVELAQLQQQNSEHYQQLVETAALFPSAMIDSELGEIPEGWNIKSIRELGRVVTGKTPPQSIQNSYSDTGAPFITPTDINDEMFVTRTNRSLTEIGQVSIKNTKIEAGSICVTCIGSQMGKATLAPSDSFTNQQINAIIVNDVSYRNYLLLNLRNRREEIFLIRSSGSTMPIINKSTFEKLSSLVPDQKVIKIFDISISPIISQILKNSMQNFTLGESRDQLLPKLLSGELLQPQLVGEV